MHRAMTHVTHPKMTHLTHRPIACCAPEPITLFSIYLTLSSGQSVVIANCGLNVSDVA